MRDDPDVPGLRKHGLGVGGRGSGRGRDTHCVPYDS
jgi:hypothetical protein